MEVGDIDNAISLVNSQSTADLVSKEEEANQTAVFFIEESGVKNGAEIMEMDVENAEEDIDVDKLPTYYTALRVTPLMGMFSFCNGVAGSPFTELMKLRVSAFS